MLDAVLHHCPLLRPFSISKTMERNDTILVHDTCIEAISIFAY